MAYTPTNWINGDLITSEKLNHIEQGIANASDIDTTLAVSGKAADAKAAGDAIAAVSSNIGILSNLATTVKTNVVAAINEVNAAIPVIDNTLSIAGAAADAKAAGDELADVKSAINDSNEVIGGVTKELTKIESNNYAKSDSDVTAGYVAQNGVKYSASSLWYTKPIPVEEGDVVRIYTYASGAFTAKSMRFVCAYNASGSAVSASGAENVNSFTVPTGIVSVVITSAGAAANVTQLMITRNYEATVYEPYFTPYYIASEDFVEDVFDKRGLSDITVGGTNLIPTAEHGAGYYYGTVGSKVQFASSTSLHYGIMPIEKNTEYCVSATPRFLVITDENDIVLFYGDTTGRYFNSGEGTKLYLSIENSIWDGASLDGTLYSLIVSKGGIGTYYNVKKPAFVSGITQNMMDARYGCALPRKRPFFTVNQEQVWYTDNLLALPSNRVAYGTGEFGTILENGIKIKATSARAGTNGYWYRVYDAQLACIAQQSQLGAVAKNDNVQSCSALVIGDSTVAQNYMTQAMLDAFTERNKTLTLLGTRGTSPNLHEGRAGWSARQYCTEASVSGTTNPFYNPTTEKFDFAYYMANQSYESVDFVVIQLGINDLYNADFEQSESTIRATADYIIEMLTSIYAYNSNQKVLLDLPTALNNDKTKHSQVLFMLRNMFVRYNDYIQYRTYNYNESKLRISNCHLILDPDSDISDNVHPTATGYEKMAMEVVSQINCWQQA